jgi:hypothetical protein
MVKCKGVHKEKPYILITRALHSTIFELRPRTKEYERSHAKGTQAYRESEKPRSSCGLEDSLENDK